jgi:hypothetical protein
MSSLWALATALGAALTSPAARPPTLAADSACQVLKPDRIPAQGRKSPLDSLTFDVAGRPVKVCYGRPSSRGRTMLGGEAVPYGQLWRTGANEPTIFYTSAPLSIAGITVPAGVNSLYTVPNRGEWEIIVNRSITQWGEESNYTPAVKAQEVGRGKVKSEALVQPIETFTLRSEPAGRGATLVLEWEKTRVRIPVKPA